MQKLYCFPLPLQPPANFAFPCSPSLYPGVIRWLEPVVHSKNQYLVSSQLQKNKTWRWYGHTQYWLANTLFWQLSINHKWMSDITDVVPAVYHSMVMVLLSYFSRLIVRTDICMDSHVTTKIFEIRLPNFLRYGAWSTCVPSVCRSAPLQMMSVHFKVVSFRRRIKLEPWPDWIFQKECMGGRFKPNTLH